ncbi:MAG: hypothetical protein BGO98_36405 [Myxococcales bacterium 68-20]|nr:MAG: hypothetical protein BGO98_36405 [Myxococcales bacterium 68-20]
MQLSDLMHRKVRVIDPEATVRDAARKMSTFGIGALPVCSEGRIVGMITDRDIIVRSLARGGAPDADRVADAMTRDVAWCFEDVPIDEAVEKMSTGQIQRLIVVNRNKRLVGMISLADLAQAREAATKAVEEIKAPTKPSALGTSGEQEGPQSHQHA